MTAAILTGSVLTAATLFLGWRHRSEPHALALVAFALFAITTGAGIAIRRSTEYPAWHGFPGRYSTVILCATACLLICGARYLKA